jgi:hypothetical protein
VGRSPLCPYALIDGNKWMDQSSKPLAVLPDDPDFRASSSARAGFAPYAQSLRHCSHPRTLGLASHPSHTPQYTSFTTLTRARSGARCHSAMRLREAAPAYDPARPPQTVAAGISTTLVLVSPRSDRQRRPAWPPAGSTRIPITRATSTLVGPREFEKSAGAAEADRVA